MKTKQALNGPFFETGCSLNQADPFLHLCRKQRSWNTESRGAMHESLICFLELQVSHSSSDSNSNSVQFMHNSSFQMIPSKIWLVFLLYRIEPCDLNQELCDSDSVFWSTWACYAVCGLWEPHLFQNLVYFNLKLIIVYEFTCHCPRVSFIFV